jgi:osmotically-inducible protein OsmY
MHYTRLDLRFLARGWTGGQLLEGVAPGPVRGVAVELASRQIEYTLVQPRRGRHAHDYGSRLVGNARTILPGDLVRLTHQTRVLAGATPVGWVTRIWCDQSSRVLTHVLLQTRRALFVRPIERIVAAEQIETLAHNQVRLTLTPREIAALPIFRPDVAIAADLQLALAAALPDPRARRAVKVRVDDGHVSLAGVVDAGEQRTRAARAALAVPGVRGLTNDLVIEESLADQVEVALAREIAARKLEGAQVRAFIEHGIVYLEGRVPTAEIRYTLEQVAVAVTGVRVIVNNLLVEGEDVARASETGPLTRNR